MGIVNRKEIWLLSGESDPALHRVKKAMIEDSWVMPLEHVLQRHFFIAFVAFLCICAGL